MNPALGTMFGNHCQRMSFVKLCIVVNWVQLGTLIQKGLEFKNLHKSPIRPACVVIEINS